MTEVQIPAPKRGPFNFIIISGIILAVAFAMGGAMLVGALNIPYFDKLVYSRFVYWAEILFLLLYAYKVERQKLFIWTEKPLDIVTLLVSVVALYFMSIGCAIISNIPSLFGLHESNAVMKAIAAFLHGRTLLIIFIAVTAGVTEEIIFRGYILTRLSLLFKDRYTPVILSSLMFSAMHYKYQSLKEFIFTFLIGILMSAYYIKYRNIKVIIIVHVLIDIISLLILTHYYKLVK